MHHLLFSVFPILLFISYFVGPSNASTTPSPSSTSTGPVPTHTVAVGKNHEFQPSETTAAIGDIIEFRFFPKNHSVVRAEYMDPCVPYELYDRGKTGFFSGFRITQPDIREDQRPTWSLKINDTNPIFFYCSAPESCQRWAMVGVINPNTSVSLDKHKNKAKEANFVLSPGESPPPEATSQGIATPTTSNLPAHHPAHHGKLSSGGIAGIVIGSVAIVTLAAALCFFVGRFKTLRETHPRNSTAHHPPPQDMAPPPQYLPPPMAPTDGSTYTNSWYGPTAFPPTTSPYQVQEQWSGAGPKIHQSPYAELRSATASPILNESKPYGITEALAHPDLPQELDAPDARDGRG
ncbi:hypothetical protein P154DRAFT_561115 [Amniculicola lignicola CBS 123094]|uniref:Cupredoxin n=1 Tax=Amniculicola lignicola CBS 123094 TaxID=1392246 RepID=A0A6A5WP18_9PLEO|nr:hypothetical protein P154DRAFT_561115 [Amniculicola lignicola CBS 123094]